jgi:hypothetical protein
VGGTYPLFVTTAGGTWSSTLTTIATVSSGGLVTGVSLGSTIISYTNTNFCGSTADTILLTTHPMPDAGSITGASTVCEGASITLTDTSAGGTWASSSVTNATVSGTGMVTGIAAGSTIISYSVTNSCGTAAAAYTVTVSPLPTAGNISGPGKVCAGNVITLTDPVTGGTWTSSNSSLAIVSSTGDVGGLTAGGVTISYAKTNICGTAVATHAVIVNVADSCITGIANTATQDALLQVFPNPNEGSFVIKLPLAAQEATIYLLDVMGRVIEQRYVTAFASLNEQFNLQNAATGNYFIRVVVDGNAYMQRITVQ